MFYIWTENNEINQELIRQAILSFLVIRNKPKYKTIWKNRYKDNMYPKVKKWKSWSMKKIHDIWLPEGNLKSLLMN